MASRVLITGSRTRVNAAVIRDALLSVWGHGNVVLVSGACPHGADRIAEMVGPAGVDRWSGIQRTGRLTGEQRGFVVMPRWSAEVRMPA